MSKDVVRDEYYNFDEYIHQFPVLSKEEEKELFLQYYSGNMEARKRLIDCNLRLVNSVAKRISQDYDFRFTLIQEGTIGLIKAINKFQLDKDVKFSTYATYWIRESMNRYIIENQSDRKIPEWMNQLAIKVNKYIEKYHEKNSINPSDELLADIFETTIQSIIKAKKVFKYSISIDSQKNNDENDQRLYELPDNSNVEDQVTQKILREELFNLLDDSLSEEEKMVMIVRYGLSDNKYRTLSQVAEELNLDEAKVTFTEHKALRKIRKYGVSTFHNYLD